MYIFFYLNVENVDQFEQKVKTEKKNVKILKSANENYRFLNQGVTELNPVLIRYNIYANNWYNIGKN